jgi:mannose-1-phosphate guanylyltransferase
MAGGKGERLWPLSTEERPKPLISLVRLFLAFLCGKKIKFRYTFVKHHQAQILGY